MGRTASTVLAIVMAVPIVSGCGTFLAPRAPKVFGATTAYSKADYDEDHRAYQVAIDHGDIPTATRIRDAMLWQTVRDVNNAYFTFRNEFHEGREWTNTTMDMAKLGMSAAATMLGGNAALSAAVTALEGTGLSVNKNFFRERTTEALFTTMDALRNEQMALIQTKLLLPPQKYGFEEAFNDAVVLLNAGNVLSALERIGADAGKNATEAREDNTAATEARVTQTLSPTTKDALELKRKLSAICAGLMVHPPEAEKLASIRKILDAAGVATSVTDTPGDLYGKLRSVLRQAQGDDNINTAVGVFKNAGVWKE